MMDYEIFKALAGEQFLDYMPEEYRECKIKKETVQKTNRTLDGICLVPPESSGRTVFPVIYINHMYQDYLKEGDFRHVMEQAAAECVDAYRKAQDVTDKLDFSNIREKVVMALINTEQNAEMLKEIPSRKFCDLSIVYRLVSGRDESMEYSAWINNGIAEMAGMTEQQLYEEAVVNTKKMFPPVVKTMDKVLRDMYISEGMPESVVDMVMADMERFGKEMYVITNSNRTNGAVSMLYEEELHTLAEKIGTDLFILPSSLHEVIAISARTGDPMELAGTVREINMAQVPLEDQLSNQVYHYDKELRKLELATDTPDKCLGSMAAEPQQVCGMKWCR